MTGAEQSYLIEGTWILLAFGVPLNDFRKKNNGGDFAANYGSYTIMHFFIRVPKLNDITKQLTEFDEAKTLLGVDWLQLHSHLPITLVRSVGSIVLGSMHAGTCGPEHGVTRLWPERMF